MAFEYPTIQIRIKAAVKDFVILLFAMYCTSELLNRFENVPDQLRMYLFIFFFMLYEPIMVSCFGNTLGHYLSDVKVKRESDYKKNIPFFQAILRFLIKFFLGWLSLLTITFTEKRQAIHDSVTKSVVILDK